MYWYEGLTTSPWRPFRTERGWFDAEGSPVINPRAYFRAIEREVDRARLRGEKIWTLNESLDWLRFNGYIA